ncbi:PAS domain-containing sensor histidine kinase [Caulobacter rhizosphaerae]|jgi:PAS domain S-box-containing protein|uniref:PAS domain-containing sensor histidine kinase n=1 Tax=Caulobacter rhizosphaerae TaxID=2010972 RepID=UPI0013D751E0|nr:PAS domain-containing protein [Caulobacter rhizosphaerae]GGL37481.1 sensor histidine kinase [Caulobacter rhizosphaerae]
MVNTRDRGLVVGTSAPGEMRERIDAFDWAATPLGSRAAWSPSLSFAVDMIVASRFPSALRWGPELVLIYNDAYAPMLGERHPRVLGKTFAEAPPTSAAESEEPERAVLAGASGGAIIEELPLSTTHPDGSVSEGYFTIRLSPMPDAAAPSGVGGVLIALTDVTRKVRTEQALRASEERYQLALQAASGVGTWDWDIVADKVYADARYAVFHNVDPERAAQGAPLSEFTKALHPDDFDRLLRSGRTSLKTTSEFLEEYRLIQADGSVKWVQTRGRVERDAKGWAVRHRGVMVDITGRKRTEQALEAAQADLRIAVDAAGLGRWDHNPQTGERFWDKRCREIYGLPGGVIENPPEAFERLVHPDDLPALMDAVRGALDPASDNTINREYRIRRDRDGATRWIETFGRAFFHEGQCVRFVGVVSDVTERKEAEADQVLREATMALALDAGNVGTWDFDVRKRHLRWSDRGYDMFGITPGAEVGLDDFYAAMHPEDREATRQALLAAMNPALRADIDVEYRTIGRDDGLERWISAKGRGFFDEAGRPTRVVGATVDITERKRAELHLRLLVNELNHRVKNSLATIQAIAAQTFHAARSLPQALEAFSARIVALAEAHDLLTRENWEGADLLDLLNRLEVLHGGPERFAIIGQLVRLSPRMALSLSMVLHELATNAVKYGALSTPQGQVRIAWTVVPGPAQPRLVLTWTETGGPPVQPPTRRGFGSRLIERGLAAELSGEARIDFKPDGVVCRIEAALDG